MWHRVHGIVAAKGLDATRLQWVWCVNNMDSPGIQAEQLYPGDAYVDWLAIDGYNWGRSQTWSDWQAPGDVFSPVLARLRRIISKPVALSEAASTSSTTGGNAVGTKSQWITDFFSYATGSDIRMVVWFNEDKETDWAVFGGALGDGTYKHGKTTYKVYSAYKTALATHNLTGSDSQNPRLLTDPQFMGQ